MNEFYDNCKSRATCYYQRIIQLSENVMLACFNKSYLHREVNQQNSWFTGDIEQEFSAYSGCLELPEAIHAAVSKLPLQHKKLFILDRQRRRKMLVFNMRLIGRFVDTRREKTTTKIDNEEFTCLMISTALESLNVLLRTEWAHNSVGTFFAPNECNSLHNLEKLLLLTISAATASSVNNTNGQNHIPAEGRTYNNFLPYCPFNDPHQCHLLPSILNLLKTIFNNEADRLEVFYKRKALINNLIILAGLLRCNFDHKDCAQRTLIFKCKILILQILGALCLYDDGHRAVIDAIEAYKNSETSSNIFFNDIFLDLNKSSFADREALTAKITVISLINALLNGGKAKHSLETRMELRSKIFQNGLPQMFNWLRSNEDHPSLLNHVDLFEMTKQEDEELSFHKTDVGVETEFDLNPYILDQFFDAFSIKKLEQASFVPILRHLIKLSLASGGNEQRLKELDAQIVGKFENAAEETPSLVLQNEEALGPRTNCGRSLEKMELDHKLLQEKCDTLTMKLTETERLLRALQLNCGEKSLMIRMTSDTNLATSEPLFHPGLLIGTRSDEESTSGAASTTSCPMTVEEPLPSSSNSVTSSTSPLPPPVAPPLPQNLKDIFACNHQSNGQRIATTCHRNNMKTLNWTIIPHHRLIGSLWLEFEDDSGTEDLIDIDILDKNFSTCRSVQNSLIDVPQNVTWKIDHDSVLTPRRAQNCQILLSKLKFLDVNKLCSTIVLLDPDNLVNRDMIEQLLKFMPTREEEEKLVEKARNAELAPADQFFYAIIKSPNYERRLKCLWVLKIFDEKSSDLKNQIEAIIKASKLLHTSKRIKKILFAVLSLGNRLNRFKQIGTAKAFNIEALNRLADIKSVAKPDYTSLHFLVDCCDIKSAETFRLKKEIAAFSEASKICVTEIYTDLNTLDEGFDLIRLEAEETRHNNEICMRSNIIEFLSRSQAVLQDARGNLNDMHNQYKLCLEILALDEKQFKNNPSDLFSIFGRFLTSFCDVRRQMKRERQELEKRQATLTRIPKVKRISFQKPDSKIDRLLNQERMSTDKCGDESRDFDSLVEALQTSEIFTGNIKRLRISLRGKSRRKTRDYSDNKDLRERLPKF